MLWVAGTGSFALEVVEYARAKGHEVAGLVELVDRVTYEYYPSTLWLRA